MAIKTSRFLSQISSSRIFHFLLQFKAKVNWKGAEKRTSRILIVLRFAYSLKFQNSNSRTRVYSAGVSCLYFNMHTVWSAL